MKVLNSARIKISVSSFEGVYVICLKKRKTGAAIQRLVSAYCFHQAAEGEVTQSVSLSKQCRELGYTWRECALEMSCARVWNGVGMKRTTCMRIWRSQDALLALFFTVPAGKSDAPSREVKQTPADWETERQTGRHRDRQSGRETDGQAERQTYRQRGRRAGR